MLASFYWRRTALVQRPSSPSLTRGFVFKTGARGADGRSHGGQWRQPSRGGGPKALRFKGNLSIRHVPRQSRSTHYISDNADVRLNSLVESLLSQSRKDRKGLF
jgi:hypothetical protein